MKKIAVALLAGLALVGCSSPSSDTAAADTESVQETPEETQEPVTPEAPPPAVTVEITCLMEYYSSFEEAWPAKHDVCEGDATDGEMTDVESRAVKAAYGKEGYVFGLGVLYGMCAQNGPDSFSHLEKAGSPDGIAEIKGALMLCPDHPKKAQINKAIAGAEKRNGLEAEGKIFGAGVFQVGDEIKAGTYYATDVEGCYWERTDANGEPIDNYFTHAAKRVQVTIRSSDYSFNSESCGQWRPVGS
ncbi:hypothetical protein [Streptomyces sp. NPDC001820]|uniref:hypothetical protein n=1 Tax=Streptomyces sp. NPDC001820 TaxID=3364613 RepID=UPI0036B4DBBD